MSNFDSKKVHAEDPACLRPSKRLKKNEDHSRDDDKDTTTRRIDLPLHDLPSGVLMKIFGDGYLTGHDVLKCSGINKALNRWFSLVNDDEEARKVLWKNVFYDGDFGKRTSVIKSWAEEWCCYWDDSYRLPRDPEKDYFFRPNLEMTKNGLVRTKDNWNLFEHNSPKEVQDVIHEIFHLKNLGMVHGDWEHSIPRDVGHGDESQCEWLPFVIPWKNKDEVLTPETLLTKLGAHKELLNSFYIRNRPVVNRDRPSRANPDYDDPEYDDRNIWFNFLDKYQEKEALLFYTGNGKLNPVPYFAVARVKPNLVAGYIGGVIYT